MCCHIDPVSDESVHEQREEASDCTNTSEPSGDSASLTASCDAVFVDLDSRTRAVLVAMLLESSTASDSDILLGTFGVQTWASTSCEYSALRLQLSVAAPDDRILLVCKATEVDCEEIDRYQRTTVFTTHRRFADHCDSRYENAKGGCSSPENSDNDSESQ